MYKVYVRAKGVCRKGLVVQREGIKERPSGARSRLSGLLGQGLRPKARSIEDHTVLLGLMVMLGY